MYERERMRAKLIIGTVLAWQLLAYAGQAQVSVTGIGIDLGAHHHKIEIIHVLPNTPASKAGLTAGLVVQKIDGTPTEGKSLYDCAKMIKGAVGSKVTLELVDAAYSKTNSVELIRAEIKIQESASMTAAQVETLAVQLANDKADTLFHHRPFQGNHSAHFAAGYWIWTESRGVGLEDYQATVELAADGSTNCVVDVRLLDDALRPVPTQTLPAR